MADTYDIVSITERTRLLPGVGFTDVEDVTYRTKPEGLVGTVTIEKAQATPEAIDKAITAEVARKHAIKNL